MVARSARCGLCKNSATLQSTKSHLIGLPHTSDTRASKEMTNTSARREVLSLYRRILHAAKTWESKSGVQTETTEERRYIKEEARTCFNENKSFSNVEQIEECIRKGEARLAIALHYRNPYPRPVNVRPLMFSKPLGKQRK